MKKKLLTGFLDIEMVLSLVVCEDNKIKDGKIDSVEYFNINDELKIVD